ncbi:MAG: hypothetical protein ABII01_01350 [Candidatus Woesearchaeota archaeon]
MYKDIYSEELVKKLVKLKKKNPPVYTIIRRRIDFILKNPSHRYKDLHFNMKGIKRIHIGPFVLVFIIDHEKKEISFEDFDHHDKIYL